MPETSEESGRTSSRGFVWFGAEPIECEDGHTIEMYESSAASSPHMWLALDETTAHLNTAQAFQLASRLKKWLTRWASHQKAYRLLYQDEPADNEAPLSGDLCPVCGEIIALGDMYVMDGDGKIHRECGGD